MLPALLRRLSHMLGETLPLSEAQMEELARAIDLFIGEQQPPAGAAPRDEPYVAMLASRALSSLGEGEVAQRLLVYGTGLVTPALWEVSRGASMWVLDLRRLTVSSEAPLELTLFRCLEVVVTATAEVWDASCGAGLLGLRHVCRTAAELLQRSPHTGEARSLAEELRSQAAAQLETLRRDRGWRCAPDVVNLDF
jgi:hypothetical protein